MISFRDGWNPIRNLRILNQLGLPGTSIENIKIGISNRGSIGFIQ